MMNLYREEEKPEKRSFGQVIKDTIEDIKLSFATSAVKRNVTIKQVTKWINELDPQDKEKVVKIEKAISSLELCSSMYGKTLDEAVVRDFVSKIQDVPEYADVVRSVNSELRCYEASRKQETKAETPKQAANENMETESKSAKFCSSQGV